ncbi:MAG: SH3 domain-containing protein [Anaerolineaceae bacterium]|nr:SH3 domain-containing protein [Anaerolineaceae bacterium]
MKATVIALGVLLLAGSLAHAQGTTSGDACVARETADWMPPTTLESAIALRASLSEIIDSCKSGNGGAPGEEGVWFAAIPDATMNSRACPGTSCERVGQVDGGVPLPVFAVERDTEGRDWYSLDLEGKTWIAGWLTRGGPDAIIDVKAPYADEGTGCHVYVDFMPAKRTRMVFLVSGTLQTSVVPRLYLPGSAEPLPAFGQYYRTFADSEDETFIRRGHRRDTRYPNGLYRIGIELDREVATVAFVADVPGEYGLHVICNPD